MSHVPGGSIPQKSAGLSVLRGAPFCRKQRTKWRIGRDKSSNRMTILNYQIYHILSVTRPLSTDKNTSYWSRWSGTWIEL